MPSNVSDYGKDFIVGTFFGKVQAAPTTFYIALMSQAPDPSGDGTMLSEPPTTAAYARQSFTNNTTNWGSPAGGVVANITAITFPVATADWPVTSHYALCTATTAGQVYLYGSFRNPGQVISGQQAVIYPGMLTVSVLGLVQQIVASS